MSDLCLHHEINMLLLLMTQAVPSELNQFRSIFIYDLSICDDVFACTNRPMRKTLFRSEEKPVSRFHTSASEWSIFTALLSNFPLESATTWSYLN